VIRRETEKYYVTKWEKARVENYKFQFIAKELEQRKKIADLQTKLETAKIVDLENTKYLDYSINVSFKYTYIIPKSTASFLGRETFINQLILFCMDRN